MSSLSLRALAKSYGPVQAVRGVDLDVNEGEFLSLLGPSGCGKTTTLQMVAGFVPPTTGSIVVDGQDLTSIAPEKRDMGVVFQSYALFPHMNVAQNIGFGLEMRRVERGELKRRVEEALAMVRLAGLEGRYPSELSGGQRQRVAIARALAIRPRVLLLDEPMSNLDAKLRGEMHVELRSLQRRLGITAVLVTHDQVEAMTMSDRIAVMTNGGIAQLGTPQEVYDRPASQFASSFLGHTNVLNGRIESRIADEATIRVGPTSFRTRVAKDQVTPEIAVFVRPERLRLGSPDQATLQGRVSTRLFLGGSWIYEIETELGMLRITQQNTGTVQPKEGETIGVSWNAEDLRVIATERSDG
ncbi:MULTISPECIES: ABC transporter ATP-binding protein [Bosea]|jgi:putative spermidine/putrescine transport system ATP-binding protein|uniref:ABC transporter ATP-binding protein n=1 Tax=Bosea TaxID=85413 RepID=UPI0012294099|nr:MULTISPECIES: ABC transporter ATP-binding protein [Bosea]MCR4524544.1 ABC transporter ATP-binding protein [Bosea sp. 47.2.35]MDR6831561.1 putative spermidine/putrescine transport system ATP-binding protein [Bosea robiniae]MDR6898270.1 putative spermidine/putrescine transport system ATP-binding protein [Bosea sp. BE109]MDR7141667.1 putative spermidine/putrescine transport system ATP-binding protein [Bosea sp. BE168]MDR7178276.1 putative spermidine/putrescine transport system ATP-binding prot